MSGQGAFRPEPGPEGTSGQGWGGIGAAARSVTCHPEVGSGRWAQRRRALGHRGRLVVICVPSLEDLGT